MVLLYSISIFTAAFLLFLVQPMIGKMFLPWVGGSSATWNTCMFFFQALLMAGYAFTHFASNKFGIKKHGLLQFALMATAIAFLPMTYAGGINVPENPSFWLIWQLLITCGLPFFMVAGISPLIQIWFARTGHPHAANPYFLYSSSNAGSLAALIAYPTIVEPYFSLQHQARIWMIGYIFLIILMAMCFRLTNKKNTDEPDKAATKDSPAPDRKTIIKWVITAALPSSLLLAVTQYMTTDLVPMPLFWVIPLMIYLLTFIIAFSDSISPSAHTAGKIAVFNILAFISFYLFVEITFFWFSVAVHLLTLFCVSLFCHRSLAETKPAVEHLTGFYLWLSIGGVLGGLFNSQLATIMFADYIEYPILIALSCLLIDRFHDKGNDRPVIGALPMLAAGLYVFCTIIFISTLNIPSLLFGFAAYAGYDISSNGLRSAIFFLADYNNWIRPLLFILASVAPMAIIGRAYRVRIFPMVAVVLSLLFIWNVAQHTIVSRQRNFFGVKKVFFVSESNIRYLAHGSTIHGKQSYQEGLREEPLTYYHQRGPLGDIFALPITAKKDLKVAVIGLGIGSTAAYARKGSQFTFFEIDPQIVNIAQNLNFFSYLNDKKEHCRVVIGDGRLKIQQEPEHSFDIILLDAFSSDAVPVHLLTVEAMQIYLSKLAENGIIAVHVSNRYLDLRLNLNALARHHGLQMLYINDNAFDPSDSANFERSQAEYALFTKDMKAVNYLRHISSDEWAPVVASGSSEIERFNTFIAWTDNHSSIFPLFKRH